MTYETPVIQIENLSKHFGKIIAVNNISFSLHARSTTALLGGNGAGKTTTISMILGLLLPTTGTIRVFDEDMRRNRYRALGRMSFSSPYIDLPQRLTVRQNLTVYAMLYGLHRIRDRLETIAEDLDLVSLMDRQYRTLSAGQKTRVMLAKSLLNEPELLLLDEPTASLDPDTADWVRDYLEAYQNRTNAAILLASHNMAEVERMCSHVLMLRQGHIEDEGSPADLITRYGRHTLEEVFLDIARNREVIA